MTVEIPEEGSKKELATAQQIRDSMTAKLFEQEAGVDINSITCFAPSLQILCTP